MGKSAFRLSEKRKLQIKMGCLIVVSFLVSIIILGFLMYVKMYFTSNEYKLAQLMNQKILREEPEPIFPQNTANTSLKVSKFAHDEGTVLDYSSAWQGYVLAKCYSDREALLVIKKNGIQYVEYLPGDGKYYTFPLSMGSGEYTISVNLHQQGTTYEVLLEVPVRAVITDELARFTIPNPLLAYDSSPEIVEIAQYLYSISENDLDFANNALEWVQLTISYDISQYEKNTDVIYRPNFDRLLKEKTAICSDYASLYAALLRSCNIPCQLVYGNVTTEQGEIYHAWNMVWLEDEQGDYSWWMYDPTANTTSSSSQMSEKPELALGEVIYHEPLFVR